MVTVPGGPLHEGTALGRSGGEFAAHGNGVSTWLVIRELRRQMGQGVVLQHAPGNRVVKEPPAKFERGTAQSCRATRFLTIPLSVIVG